MNIHLCTNVIKKGVIFTYYTQPNCVSLWRNNCLCRSATDLATDIIGER